MKIRTRLTVSNFLMILVPVMMTLVTALLCMGLIWLGLSFGGGLGFDDREDLEEAGEGIVTVTAQALSADDDAARVTRLSRLSSFLDDNAMRLVVTRDGETFYSHGTESGDDAALAAAADGLASGGSLSVGERTLFVEQVHTQSGDFQIALYGTETEMNTGFLEMLLAIVAVILVAAILITLLLTNHFLTRFVFRKIEAPLDILAAGVQEIGAGNLDYRIDYRENDEFAPICAEFNEMALRLKRSVEATQRQEESRKQLMASMSHDLRSPLTSIQAYVEGLLDGVAATPEKQQAYLQTIKAKAEEIQRMVTQIFQYSKMDLENYPVDLVPTKLDEELSAFLEVVAQDYAAKGLIVETGTMDAVTAMADAELLERCIVNILDNSARYKTAETGHATLTIRDAGTSVQITIADDGPGVPEAAVAKLFDVFYRSDPSRHDPNQGSGLGLAIVARAVARMGGTAAAGNVAPHGLAVTLTLPKEEENDG